jgi:hypothetical protein
MPHVVPAGVFDFSLFKKVFPHSVSVVHHISDQRRGEKEAAGGSMPGLTVLAGDRVEREGVHRRVILPVVFIR